MSLKTNAKCSYTKKEVAKITGMAERTIQFYSETGVIKIKNVNTGRGRPRLYDKNNILDTFVIMALSMYGISLKIMRKILSQLQDKDKLLSAPVIHIDCKQNVIYDMPTSNNGSVIIINTKTLFGNFLLTPTTINNN